MSIARQNSWTHVLTINSDPSRATALKAYMRLFDWSGCNILQSMRIFCGRIVFKGETQQVDRIMVAFAHRWCECNPNHGFKSSGKFPRGYDGNMLT
jgi:Sec7-like guanine-nucleotide exchange factor